MSNNQKLELVNTRKTMHMSFEDGGQSNYESTIHYPNHIHHGRKIILITWTPKLGFMEYGKTETYYKCDLFPDKEYKTLNGLLKKMGLPKYEPPKKNKDE